MTTLQLTPAQHAILAYAIEHTGGKIEWFPDNIKGGARTKVLEGLFNRDLIIRDSNGWFVAAEGYDALGRARPTPATIHADSEVEAAVSTAEANWAQEKQDAAKRLLKVGVESKPRTGENSKQAEVIRMLQRPEGATISQICAATGWQAHTVRGTFAGALKKKLGLTITSEKPEGGERIYRITTMNTETGSPANRLRVRFTRKPMNLQEVLAAKPYDNRPEPVVISETRELTTAEYDVFANTLLQDRDWLAGKGGYSDNATRHVVEVKAENRKTLYVDPSGSAYGRYVGIAVED